MLFHGIINNFSVEDTGQKLSQHMWGSPKMSQMGGYFWTWSAVNFRENRSKVVYFKICSTLQVKFRDPSLILGDIWEFEGILSSWANG